VTGIHDEPGRRRGGLRELRGCIGRDPGAGYHEWNRLTHVRPELDRCGMVRHREHAQLTEPAAEHAHHLAVDRLDRRDLAGRVARVPFFVG